MAAAERYKLPVLRITYRELEKRCKRQQQSEDSRLTHTIQTSSSGDLLEGSSTENEGSSTSASDWCNDISSQSLPVAASGSKTGGGLLHIKHTSPQKEKKRRTKSSNPRPERTQRRASEDQRDSDEYIRERPPSTRKLWEPSDDNKETLKENSSGKRPLTKTDASKRKRSSKDLGSDGRKEKGSCLAEWKQCTDGKIKRMMSRWAGDVTKLQQIVELCENLQVAGENMLLQSLEVSTKQEVGSKMWKLGHYPIIESLRKQRDESLKCELVRFLENTTQFYISLIEKLQAAYNFQLQLLMSGGMEFSSKTHHRTVMMAVHVCEWCYICLGDCSRYQQQLSATPNWSEPQSFYLIAQKLAPKDGKPYNQLAVIALNSHLRLDAIYYYMRSLTAKNPFQSAHDSLVGLFEDTSRKAKKQEESEKLATERAEREALRKQQKMEKRRQRKLHKHQKKNNKTEGKHVIEFPSGRKEVWIFSNRLAGSVSSFDGEDPKAMVSAEGQAEGSEVRDVEFGDLTSSEILKRLISAFLVVHGKIFTKIGIETFEISQEKLCKLWVCVLKGHQKLNAAVLYLKMMLISIFSIHNAAENHQANEAMQYYCGLGIGLGLQLTTTLLESCLRILESDTLSHQLGAVSLEPDEISHHSQGTKPDDETDQDTPLSFTVPPPPPALENSIVVFLPAIRVWFDWLTQQQDLYNECHHRVPRSTIHDFWRTACVFFNKMRSIYPSLFDSSPINTKNTQLWEDRTVAGFMPLKSLMSVQDMYSIKDVVELTPEQHGEQCLCRIVLMMDALRAHCQDDNFTWGGQTVVTFDKVSGEFSANLLQDDDPPLAANPGGPELQDENQEDSSIATTPNLREDKSEGDDRSSSSGSDSEDVIVEEDSEMEDDEASLQIEQLKAQREILTRQIEEHDIAVETAKTVLSEATNKAIQEVHIIPKYLVPDTNCFVDMLASIKTLVQSSHFTVATPLVVLAELEGLSKGSLDSSSQRENSDQVTTGAKAALEYISTTFTARNSHLKALTTQGSLLHSLSFRAELTDKASNDDLILESCVQLHSKVSKGRVNEKGIESYSVVLLTDDRNLRVKAHARNMPTRDIPDFMKLVQQHCPT